MVGGAHPTGLFLRREIVPDANRLADLADRFFVVILDPGIDDECGPDDLPCAGIHDPDREHNIDARLLPLCRAGYHEGPAFRLSLIVVLDVLKISKEPLLDLGDSCLLGMP